jgi:hypothetical protein
MKSLGILLLVAAIPAIVLIGALYAVTIWDDEDFEDEEDDL